MAADRSSNGSVPAAGISRLRELLSNPLSLVGLALAAVALVNILFLFLIDLMSDRPSPYIGILAYMVAPGFLILGLLLEPIEAPWQRWPVPASACKVDRGSAPTCVPA